MNIKISNKKNKFPPLSIKKKNIIVSFLLFFLSIFPLYETLAEEMQSSTYRIISDTVNVGGQTFGNSTNYILGDTLGEIGTGDSSSTNYSLHAGFWQMQTSYISISNPSDLALVPIGGINGEASEGTMSWTVTTDNIAGYTMNIKTTSTPALTSTEDSFDDYAPSGADPDYNFSIVSTTSAFGFSPEGADASDRFKDNGVICNSGILETGSKCWDGLSTTPKTIFQKTTSNHPTGSIETVRFRAESGADHIQTSGSYSAPIVVTAITL